MGRSQESEPRELRERAHTPAEGRALERSMPLSSGRKCPVGGGIGGHTGQTCGWVATTGESSYLTGGGPGLRQGVREWIRSYGSACCVLCARLAASTSSCSRFKLSSLCSCSHPLEKPDEHMAGTHRVSFLHRAITQPLTEDLLCARRCVGNVDE